MKITALTNRFVADVSEIDLRHPISQSDASALRHALLEFAVLVFRAQPLDSAQQFLVAGFFGRASHCGNITNIGADEKIVNPQSPDAIYARGNQLWHMDSTFVAIPPKAALLSARELPPTGGATQFADLRAGCSALSYGMTKRVNGAVVKHNLAALRRRIGLPAPTAGDPGYFHQSVDHPLVVTHPESGRRNLFFSAHADCIHGLSIQESDEILNELTASVTRTELVYTHQWQLDDLVVWDNRCVLHRVLPYDSDKHRRKLVRTEVLGDAAPA